MALCDQSATDLLARMRRGEIRSRDIVSSVFQRMEEQEPTLNAFVTRTRDLAFQRAEAADRRIREGRPLPLLNGIPIAVKDNICTRGIRTTCASRMLQNYIPPYDATAYRRALAAGAVPVGKTNLDEFGMGSSGENSAFGPTRNPVDPRFVAGGSSGGSAAAVAAGETILALATDTGGSIRLPAAFCGVAGMKPTYGRVSRYGMVAYASSLDQIGVMARKVEDCALLLKAVCGYDSKDSTSVRGIPRDFQHRLRQDVKDIRLGLPRETYGEGLDPRIRKRILEAVRLLAAEGAEIVDVSLPHSEYAVAAYYLIATAEASSNLARYDGVKYGFRSSGEAPNAAAMTVASRSEGFGPEVKRRILLGSFVLSEGYYDAYYRKAREVQTLIKRDVNRALESVDCLVTPVSPGLPFRLGEKIHDPLQMLLVDRYTVLLNLCGLPGMSLNCGRLDGLPVGFQITGRAFDETTVLRVGWNYEQIAGRQGHGI
jgi:aspartyl-tRNA(Asn)/glutamyl-tRNA(Gln) amidotransferase subunit A